MGELWEHLNSISFVGNVVGTLGKFECWGTLRSCLWGALGAGPGKPLGPGTERRLYMLSKNPSKLRLVRGKKYKVGFLYLYICIYIYIYVYIYMYVHLIVFEPLFGSNTLDNQL